MQTYHAALIQQFGELSMVPAIRAGRALTNEDNAILDRMSYKNPKGREAGYVFQAVRIMEKGLELEPFKS